MFQSNPSPPHWLENNPSIFRIIVNYKLCIKCYTSTLDVTNQLMANSNPVEIKREIFLARKLKISTDTH